MLPLVFEREILFPKLAKLQPYLFGIGAAGISLFMMGAGTLGVPRRHWDITFSDATLSYKAQYDVEFQWDGIVTEISTDSGATWRRSDKGLPGQVVQALVADPHHIRDHVIIVSKDHPRRL